MNMKDKIEIDGIIKDAYPDLSFKVELDNGKSVFAYLSGKMKMHYIKIVVGDKVKVEISKYDISRGRIIYRY
ncbi:translation initiation factor IF-1 [Patescibacteria group bacterium]|nr:translation initiation factor IF-1 [Patescibacteria group bacterium]